MEGAGQELGDSESVWDIQKEEENEREEREKEEKEDNEEEGKPEEEEGGDVRMGGLEHGTSGGVLRVKGSQHARGGSPPVLEEEEGAGDVRGTLLSGGEGEKRGGGTLVGPDPKPQLFARSEAKTLDRIHRSLSCGHVSEPSDAKAPIRNPETPMQITRLIFAPKRLICEP